MLIKIAHEELLLILISNDALITMESPEED